MQVSQRMWEHFPELCKWIEHEIPKVRNKEKVWAAFMKYSELSAKHALRAVEFSPHPLLDFKVMTNANGKYNGKKEPNVIYIDRGICRRFENKDSKEPKMHLLLESTILHELVHWGDAQDGRDQDGEEGKKFEQAAYGKDIDRYW